MSGPLERGRFFLPGPTEVDPAVLRAQVVPLFGHRDAEAARLVGGIDRGLRPFFGSSRRVIVGTMSATGFMEAAVRAGVRRKVLCLVNGAFSERFAEIARGCGREVEVLEVPWGDVVDPDQVAERLARGGFDAVTLAHSETSTGALNPVGALAEAVRRHDDVFLLVDSVTGVGGARMATDEWGLDMVLTGSQKALAMPPGLAFCVASERLLERAATLPGRGYYLDLVLYARYAELDQTPTTPAMTLLAAAALQVERMAEETVAGRLARHAELATYCHAWVDTLRADRGLSVAVLAPDGHRSPTVTCVRVPDDRTGPEVTAAMRRRGFVIGAGYGRMKDTTVRIGHMGDHTLGELEDLLAALTDELCHPGVA
jgi:aspartate aminotransferase-like enzyme